MTKKEVMLKMCDLQKNPKIAHLTSIFPVLQLNKKGVQKKGDVAYEKEINGNDGNVINFMHNGIYGCRMQ